MEYTNYRGINYAGAASKVVNRNVETGIRYGIIPAHAVGDIWYELSEPVYQGTIDVECLNCKQLLTVDLSDLSDLDVVKCEQCGHVDDYSSECDDIDPVGYSYRGDGYKLYQSTDSSDIWVLESPYYTYAQFCSPCAPGACYLTSPLATPDADNKCCCLGPDFFDDSDDMPCPIYSVVDNTRVDNT